MSNQFNNGAEMKYFSLNQSIEWKEYLLGQKNILIIWETLELSVRCCSVVMMADVSGESGCCRDKEDEIYITSASVIELDCRKAADNDSYDSGIYNSSTHTGDQWQCVTPRPWFRAGGFNSTAGCCWGKQVLTF